MIKVFFMLSSSKSRIAGVRAHFTYSKYSKCILTADYINTAVFRKYKSQVLLLHTYVSTNII